MKPGRMFSVFNGNDSVGFILDVTVPWRLFLY